MTLVSDGVLTLDTTARSLLGHDLPLIDDGVTVEHLLAHRSGIGDYLDESMLSGNNDYIMTVPVHQLDSTEAYLAVLGGHPQVEVPGTTFRYNNGGYVVLALLAERATGTPFTQLVDDRVVRPAHLGATAFLRSDEHPGDVAVGYLSDDGLRSNVLHLPVVGSGDGGLTTTTDDLHRLWPAFFGDRIVPGSLRRRMVEPGPDDPRDRMRYGLGFWLHPTGTPVFVEGCDAGISCRSVHDPATSITHTTISNTSTGTWPMTKALDQALGLS